MRYFKEEIGIKGKATYYLHEPSEEIDPKRKFPVIIVLPGGGYMWTSFREAEPIASQFYAKDYHAVVLDYSTEGLSAYTEGNYPKKPSSIFPQPLIELVELITRLDISVLKSHFVGHN